MPASGPDRWLWPHYLDGSNNQIVVNEDGASRVVTLDTGAFYAFKGDDGTLQSDHGVYSLYDELLTKLNAAASNTYDIEPITPLSDGLMNGGMRLKSTSVGMPFFWEFSHGSFTLDPRLLGYEEGRSTDSEVAPDSGIVDSPQSIWVWQSYTLIDGIATKKSWDSLRKSEASDDFDTANAYDLEHASKTVHPMVYEWVPGGHVMPDRVARDRDYANVGGLRLGDTNNQWWDLWQSAKRLNQLVIVHDEGDIDLEVASHPYEVVKFDEKRERGQFSETVKLQRMSGEFYRLEATLVRLGGTWDGNPP